MLVDNKEGGVQVTASHGCKLTTKRVVTKWRPLMGVS